MFSFLVFFAVVLLLAKCEELLLLLFLQFGQSLAAFLVQVTQLLIQCGQRLFRPTGHMRANTQTKHAQVKIDTSIAAEYLMQ